jgi:hypothetical protein
MSTHRQEREHRVNLRVVPTGKAIEESVDLASNTLNRLFQRVPHHLLTE